MVSTQILCLLILVGCCTVFSDFCQDQYEVIVRKTRAESYSGTCYTTTCCGFLCWQRCRKSKSCTKYRTEEYYTTEYRIREVCCPGFTGSNCDITACTSCQNITACITPEKCYCHQANTDCQTEPCSATLDCYPGTCNPANDQCACSPGFTANDCSEILSDFSGGQLNNCQVNLIGEDIHGKDFSGSCSEFSDKDDSIVYSATQRPNIIDLSYDVQFVTPPDIPPLPDYITEATLGVIGSYVELSLFNKDDRRQWGPEYLVCVIDNDQEDQPSRRNPYNVINCQNLHYIWSQPHPTHDDVLKIDIEIQYGGYKIYKNPFEYTRYYNSFYETFHFETTFDLEPPQSCIDFDTCAIESPYACEFVPDISKDDTALLDFEGWSDNRSGLQGFRYTVYYMDVDTSGLLTEGSEYTSGTLSVDDSPPFIQFMNAGMYSAIFEAVDNVGNVAKARTFFLFDNTSEITINSNYPVRIDGAEQFDSVYWVSSPGARIVISWQNRYTNAFLTNNKLLGSVRRDLDIAFDDNYGKRTVTGLDHYLGISTLAIGFAPDDNVASERNFTMLGPFVDTYTQTVPFKQYDIMHLYLSPGDILGNRKVESFKFCKDYTQASAGRNITVLKNDLSCQQFSFSSSISINAEDHQSGIKSIDITINDMHDGWTLLDHFEHKVGDTKDCQQNQHCYCDLLGRCFRTNHNICLHNCLFLDRDNHTFSIDYFILNGAGLITRGSYYMYAMEDLSGLNSYPPLQAADSVLFSGNKSVVVLTWEYTPTCYTPEVVYCMYTSVDGSKFELNVSANQNTLNISGLDECTNYQAELYVTYQGGEISETVAIKFSTHCDSSASLPNKGSNIGLIVGLTFALLIAGMLVIVGVICYKRGFWLFKKKSQEGEHTYENTVQPQTKNVYEKSIVQPATQPNEYADLKTFQNPAYEDIIG